MTDLLYIRLGLTVGGPYSVSDLHELSRRGKFSKSHDVSADRKSWTSASAHPELFPEVRRPQSVDRNKHRVEPAETGISEDAPRVEIAAQSPVHRDSVVLSEQSSARISVDGALFAGAENSVPVRPLSKQTVWAVVVGPLGFILLLVCTAMIVIRLRSSQFAFAGNIGLTVLLGLDLVLGGIAVALGHLAIRTFQRQPGTINERNLIVVGLSCGYTILILTVLFFVVLLISTLG